MTRRTARIALVLTLGVCAAALVPFFGDPNPQVALAALAAWALLIIAMITVKKP